MTSPVNDFNHQRVPDSQTVSSGHIALVITGGIIAIPCFIMAANLGNSLGFVYAMFAFILGSSILALMMACTNWVASITRLSLAQLTENAFGYRGAKLINGLIAFTLIGWYGVNCKMFGDAANTVMTTFDIYLPNEFYMLIGSLLMLTVSLKGFKGIDTLALWLVPLMIAFICYAAFSTIDSHGTKTLWQFKDDISLADAISAVIGTYIVGVVIQPDYSRFAKSPKNASIAAGLTLLLLYPAILILTSIPAIISQQSDLIQVMITIGIGVPAFLLLLLSSWSSNVLCLYSSSLSMSTIIPWLSLNKTTLAIGILGTLIAFTDVQTYFIDFLIVLGILIPPVGAIYCLDFWLTQTHKSSNEAPQYQWFALLSWLAGCFIGFLSFFDYFSLLQIASLDSIFVSTIVFYLLKTHKIFTFNSNI